MSFSRASIVPFFIARRSEQACDLGLGCIPTQGQLVAGVGDSISALVSSGGSMWHEYLVRCT